MEGGKAPDKSTLEPVHSKLKQKTFFFMDCPAYLGSGPILFLPGINYQKCCMNIFLQSSLIVPTNTDKKSNGRKIDCETI